MNISQSHRGKTQLASGYHYFSQTIFAPAPTLLSRIDAESKWSLALWPSLGIEEEHSVSPLRPLGEVKVLTKSV